MKNLIYSKRFICIMKNNFLFVLIFIANILNIIGNYYDGFIYNDNYENHDNINVLSISYELT
jgi:hypothetical protein